ncbi:MAG: transporter substrate-binding domain-containing protein [Pseudomonadota bacterium]
MKVKIAYIEEAPFYWTREDGSVTGADIELAETVLRAIGVTDIEYQLRPFAELIPGLQAARWDMNVPLFVTAERAERVNFSLPVWSLGDGFIVQRGNPKALASYEAVSAQSDARLGIIPGQVQYDSAKSAGVSDSQIVMFNNQPEAVAALLAGKIDAFAATAAGNRIIARDHKELQAVAHDLGKQNKAPVGAFSFNKNNLALLQAVNEQLRHYLGSQQDLARVAKYGLV